ncbi:cupin domain-containing protein [Effusibacillus pohliae]|uniref:cupin domain-containing protein n=1 Tax=Effusibacillus pohliae TaxID=232270 RepID=UPI000381128E|nr:cupin domain-containing protein [Effusibacillus pohliae]
MVIVHAGGIEAEDTSGAKIRTLLTKDAVAKGRATFGIVIIPPGTRIPLEGTGSHAEDEYSYVISGSLIVGSGEREYRVQAGDATLIPAGVPHWAYNDGNEEVMIVWTLVNRD